MDTLTVMSRRSTKERLSLTVNDEHASKSTSASLSTSTMSVKDSDNGNCESQAVKEVETYETLAKELSTLKVKLAAKIEKMKDADMSVESRDVENIQLTVRVRRVLKGHQGKVLAVDWSPDRRHLLSSSQDGKIVIWDAFASRKERAITMPTTWIMSCCYGPSGRIVAAGGLDNKCTVFPLHEGQEPAKNKRAVAMHSNYLSSCTFTCSDHQLLTASGDGTCGLWDVESSQLVHYFRGHQGDVLTVRRSRANPTSIFASGGCDNKVMLWDMRSGECEQMFEGHEADVNCLSFHPCGEAVASGSDDATCRVFDTRADNQVQCLQKQSVVFPCNGISFAESGRLLFGGYSDCTIQVWDVLKGFPCTVLYGHENRVSCVRVSPDGFGMASGSWDYTVRVWA